jgi:protein subunit release factor A
MRKNHLETIKWLKHHPTKENKRVIADVYIAMEGYANVVDSLKDYLSSLKEKEDDVLKETALVQLAAAYYMQKEYANLATLHDTHKDFMKARKSYKNFAMLCRSRAEDLKTSQEVREYINDADVLKEIFDKAKVSVG